MRLANLRDKSASDWAISANETFKKLVVFGDHAALINYQNLGREIQLAIPTREHFLPLIYVLALKDENESIEIFNDVVENGSLSMSSFKIN